MCVSMSAMRLFSYDNTNKWFYTKLKFDYVVLHVYENSWD